jgi:hypothetical protein
LRFPYSLYLSFATLSAILGISDFVTGEDDGIIADPEATPASVAVARTASCIKNNCSPKQPDNRSHLEVKATNYRHASDHQISELSS